MNILKIIQKQLVKSVKKLVENIQIMSTLLKILQLLVDYMILEKLVLKMRFF